MASSNMYRYKTMLNKVLSVVESNFYTTDNGKKRVFSIDFVRICDLWLYGHKYLQRKSGNIVMFEENDKVYIGFKIDDIQIEVDLSYTGMDRIGQEIIDLISLVDRNKDYLKYSNYKQLIGDLTIEDIQRKDYDKILTGIYKELIKKVNELNSFDNFVEWTLEDSAFKSMKSRRDVFPILIFDFNKNEVSRFDSNRVNTTNSARYAQEIVYSGKINRVVLNSAVNACYSSNLPLNFIKYDIINPIENVYISKSGYLN